MMSQSDKYIKLILHLSFFYIEAKNKNKYFHSYYTYKERCKEN